MFSFKCFFIRNIIAYLNIYLRLTFLSYKVHFSFIEFPNIYLISSSA